MNIIGIDFSINSTAVAVYNNNTYTFYNFVNTDSFLGKKESVLAAWKIHDEIKNFVNIVSCVRDNNSTNYQDEQIEKLKSYDKLTDIIIKILPEKDNIIGIEGFSFASQGRGDIDLVIAGSILRYKLLKQFGKNLVIIPPSQLKKSFTGKGNANKVLIHETLLKTDNPELLNHDYIKYIKDHDVIKKEKVVKPIDDINDSISIIHYLKNNLEKI
jgi:hypothetical protein